MDFLSFVKDKAGLISAIGALIIFFSWIVTNTLGDRLKSIKSGLEGAEETFRLYRALDELKGQLNSLAMEALAARRHAMPSDDTALSQARRRFDSARLSGHQLEALMNFSASAHTLSSAGLEETEASKEISAVSSEVDAIVDKVREKRKVAEECNTNSPADQEKFIAASADYVSFLREEAIPRVGPFYERITTATNTRRDEAQADLSRTKALSDIAKKWALVLYIAGSMLVLWGTFVDKTKKKAPDMSAQAQTKSDR